MTAFSNYSWEQLLRSTHWRIWDSSRWSCDNVPLS